MRRILSAFIGAIKDYWMRDGCLVALFALAFAGLFLLLVWWQ
jgi:hypothetical protein